MAERVPALISAVLQDGDFDVEEPAALRWLSDGHRLMVKRARSYRRRIALRYGAQFSSTGAVGIVTGSPVIAGVSSFEGLAIDLLIVDHAGGGIPAGTTITALDPEAETLTMSNLATATIPKEGYTATVPDGFAYPLPEEVVEVIEVLVNGLPYGRGRHSDIATYQQGWLLLSGIGGVAVEDESLAGAYALSLVPPVSGDAEVQVYAVCRAPALLATDDTTLKVPAEYDPALINYAFAMGLQRDEGRPELARSYLEEFSASCTELRREVAIRNAPRKARVSGYNV